MVHAAKKLSAQVDELHFGPPVAHVYNPLEYAWAVHAQYIDRFGQGRKKTLFLGMNPGPFGMMQNGIPFGEIHFVKEWLCLEALVKKPQSEHPKRPILGFHCTRSEVSGKRLWGLFKTRFGSPEAFFNDHFVVNYCPLVFLEPSGKNLTPDKLPKSESKPLIDACDAHLLEVVRLTQPEWIIGVGKFALQCIQRVVDESEFQVLCIPHPSPANPSANRDWSGQTTLIMESSGPWAGS